MIVKTLPNFTAERYYLLAEIEDVAKFYFGDERSEQYVRKNNFGVMYCLWNLKVESNQNIIEKIYHLQELCSSVMHNPTWSVIFVEAIISDSTNWDNERLRIAELLSWALSNVISIGPIIIGVADKPSSTVALAHFQDFLLHLSNRKISLRSVAVVANARSEMLGHDPSREPDATADIFQALCYDETRDGSIEGLKHFYDSIADHLDPSEASTLTIPENSSVKNFQLYIFVAILSISIIALSIYLGSQSSKK